MFNPVSTYRIQFHKDFTFTDLEKIIPYLENLGIKTLYASPVFVSVPGSMHGYDGTNPHQINPEIGTEEQLRSLSTKLKKLGISWIQDIVPNHMAFHQDNQWLMDVLEKGNESAYYSFFDIDWHHKLSPGKVMAPFLADTTDELIKKGELKIDIKNEKIVFNYNEQTYPLQKKSIDRILTFAHDKNSAIQKTNENTDLLIEILNEQHYNLCVWNETNKKINYRRFFTINGLICLNMQDEKVFNHFHRYIKSLIDQQIFQGIRVDHVDGLYDPSVYLKNLRKLCGEETYIIVEKILQPNEILPAEWPVQGTTGYDFLAQVNNLLTNKKSKKSFTHFYENFHSKATSLSDDVANKKSQILFNFMGGELENLTNLFITSFSTNAHTIEKNIIKNSIALFLIHFPVYRLYSNSFPFNEDENNCLRKLFKELKNLPQESNGYSKNIQHSGFEMLEDTFLNKHCSNKEQADKAKHFYQRCMQFTGPLVAKGIEDTLMYTYNRFIGHNEVGDSCTTFGLSVKKFHKEMSNRQQRHSLSLHTTSTHDTKRGEDFRARLNVLSDIAPEWTKMVAEWRKLNEHVKQNGWPDANDEYFIYQTLAGSYAEDDITYKERLEAYLLKALREAKTHTGWDQPNERYEQATMHFISNLLDQKQSFWKSFYPFYKKIIPFGIVNSIAQLLIKFTTPGIVDVYQGTELWDLSFVDPDNRRPVDYELREKLLKKLQDDKNENNDLLKRLFANRDNAMIKLFVMHTFLNERKNNKELFTTGEYIPLKTEGLYKHNIIAYARRYKHEWVITAVSLHAAQLCAEEQVDLIDFDWYDTAILLPPEAPVTWHNILSTEKGHAKITILAKEIFTYLPVAFIRLLRKENERGAGVLMPITSLPSSYGIGDFGSGAKEFADFLNKSCQIYWQLLPINPVSGTSSYSPYSSACCMAGNSLLISPELLYEDGLLSESDLKNAMLPLHDQVDYELAEKIKRILNDKSWRNFLNGNFESLKKHFENYCASQEIWLHDFAIFEVLIETQQSVMWNEWPEQFKNRDPEALKNFAEANEDAINKIKWQQFIFFKQWKELKTYCNSIGICLFGDLPFYVSYNSVDVWAHPEIFSLGADGTMAGIAGVPPDYFSVNGQLWNMPTFNWKVLKETNYDWWVQRIKKNLELFNLLRLDHFRAFEAYYEVPAGEETARNGVWKKGPHEHFFRVIEDEFGKLPFIAEDLGEKMDDVYKLRDKLKLPGMKVLQFAFGDNLPVAVDVPHNFTSNFVVYTGTHDNNTTLGWFRQETNKNSRKRIHTYTRSKPNENNIHLELSRMAYSSVAKIVILPIQDLLGLNETKRFNTPGTDSNNWLWRLTPKQLTSKISKRLRKWTIFYNRI